MGALLEAQSGPVQGWLCLLGHVPARGRSEGPCRLRPWCPSAVTARPVSGSRMKATGSGRASAVRGPRPHGGGGSERPETRTPASTRHAPDHETQATSLQAHGAEKSGTRVLPGVSPGLPAPSEHAAPIRVQDRASDVIAEARLPQGLRDAGTHRPPALRGSAPPPPPNRPPLRGCLAQ